MQIKYIKTKKLPFYTHYYPYFLPINEKSKKKGHSGGTAGEFIIWRGVFSKKWMTTLKYSEIHLLAAAWYMYARILEILDQNLKKILPAVMG